MNPIRCVELAYPEDCLACYRALSDLPGFALLQSADFKSGRYDILAAYPYDTLHLSRQEFDQGQIDAFINRSHSSSFDTPFPFVGGFIGYISYDLGAVLQGLQVPEQPVLKDQPLLYGHYYYWGIIVDHWEKKAWLAGLDLPNTAAIQEQIDKVLHLWQAQEQALTPFQLQADVAPSLAYPHYAQCFDRIKASLTQGRCYQVNYTQAFTAPFSGSTWSLYEKISRHNPVPYAAYLQGQDESILSFSPERYCFIDQGKIRVEPIKGTIKRLNDPQADASQQQQLLDCPKNRAENVMIVDLMRNDLGQLAKPGSVEVKALCELKSFKAVHHLVSTIEAECLDHIQPLQAFFSCFPSGSITGAPKREAMKVIAEEEQINRGVYCGSVFYQSSHGRLDSNVAIRTLTARNQALHMAAGGGLVIDSDCEEEYLECLLKLEAIFNAIGQ